MLDNPEKTNDQLLDEINTIIESNEDTGNQCEKIEQILIKNPYLALNPEERQRHLPIHVACLKHKKDIAELLIKHGANVNIESKQPCEFGSPLDFAIYQSKEHLDKPDKNELIYLLLNNGADVNYKDVNHFSILHCAARRRPELIPMLLTRGAEVKKAEGEKNSLLSELLSSDCWSSKDEDSLIEPMKALIQAGANINLKGGTKDHPLSEAIQNGHNQVAKSLLLEYNAKADPNGKNSILSKAVSKNNIEITQILLEKGADATNALRLYFSGQNYSPEKHQKMVDLLVRHGADVDILPCISANDDFVKILLSYGANPETTDKKGLKISDNNWILDSTKELCKKPPVPSLKRLCVMYFWKNVKEDDTLITARNSLPSDLKEELPNPAMTSSSSSTTMSRSSSQ